MPTEADSPPTTDITVLIDVTSAFMITPPFQSAISDVRIMATNANDASHYAITSIQLTIQ